MTVSGQGGLLDVYFNPSDDYIYFTYSHKSSKLTRSKQLSKKSSTAIARGRLIENEIKDFEILLIAKPEFLENRHYGSRIAIKGDDSICKLWRKRSRYDLSRPLKAPREYCSYQDRWRNPSKITPVL